LSTDYCNNTVVNPTQLHQPTMTTSNDKQTQRTKKAFSHLNTIKPYDGWSIDTYINSLNQNLVMLKRRNAPLSDRGFVELALEKDTGCVVGIVSHIGETSNCAYVRGVALVEKDGKLLHSAKEKRFTIDTSSGSSNNNDDEQETKIKKGLKVEEVREEIRQNRENAKDSIRHHRSSQEERNRDIDGTSSSSSHRQSSSVSGVMTDDQNKDLIKLAMKCYLVVICVATIFRILSSSAFSSVFLLVLPLAVLYATQTCPNQDTFDAKKELKRVLRGNYEPQNQTEKPKSWLSETVTRIQASVTAEVATGLGHEVSFLNVYGVFTFVTVHVPVMKLKLYFIGIFDEWRYILHMNSEPPSQEG